MQSELEYLLKTHGEKEGLNDQSSLQDMVTGLRRLADDLGSTSRRPSPKRRSRTTRC
jgi:hypothetical protein